MRRAILIATLCLAACSMQQSGRDIRVLQPPILADQSWKVSQEDTNGCTISAGDMDVTQAHGSVQVATFYSLNPGDRYRISVGKHIYEVQDRAFSDKESRAIVNDFMHADFAYTERQELVVTLRGPDWKRFTNKIPLAGFAEVYRQCGHSRRGK